MKAHLFKSERLGFRVMDIDDTERMFSISSDTEVMKYFPRLYNDEEAESLVVRQSISQEKHGYSFYATDFLEDGICIGFIGLSRFEKQTSFSPCTEIGWRLDKKYWKMGLATEGALRCLKFASEILGLEEIYSLTSKINIPSERVMQKIGMKYNREFIHPSIDPKSPLNPHVLYKVEL